MLYSLENVKKVYGSRAVIDIGELAVEAGKIYTLIGPNGAGKTSLLKILAFLDKPTEGRILFQGTPVSYRKNHLTELRRSIVLLDQSPIMFSGSVVKNIEFGLRVRKVPKKEREARVDEILEKVGMSYFRNIEARNLSGGETKRVALARALVLQPDVLLCDEPTANVDNENQEIILDVLGQLNKERTCSVIFSTHYLSQAQKLADHTLLLQHGSLSDITSENIFRFEVVGRRDGLNICQLNGQLSLLLPDAMVSQKKGTTKLHLNPRRIQLDPPELQVGEGNVVAGHVAELRQDRGRVQLTVNIGVLLRVEQPLAEYLRLRPVLGQKVNVCIPHGAIRSSGITPRK